MPPWYDGGGGQGPRGLRVIGVFGIREVPRVLEVLWVPRVLGVPLLALRESDLGRPLGVRSDGLLGEASPSKFPGEKAVPA